MIEIELPYPPSVNHYKDVGLLVTTKSGKSYQPRVNSAATKKFYWEVWYRIQQKGLKDCLGSTIDLGVMVWVHPPDKRRRDLDNLLKVLLDSLVRGGLIKDDSQIARLLVQRLDIIREGKVIVRIEELNP